MKRQRNKIISVLLIGMITFSLTGCKETDVLKEIVYRDGYEVDTSKQVVKEDSQDATQDENLDAKEKNTDSKEKEDSKEDLAVKDETAQDNGKSDKLSKGDNASTSAEHKANLEKKEDGEDFGNLDNDQDSQENDTEENGGTSNEDTGEDEGAKKKPTSNKNSIKITDSNGEEQEIPEDAETVVAVGEAASMVEMLGGSGRLLGSSENFTNNALAKEIFKDVKNGSVEKWWSGNGADEISDANFKKLIKAQPDVVFIISGDSSFSSTQLEKLDEEGISYLTIYPFNTPENIKKNTSLMAKVLGDFSVKDKDQKNASKMASQYNKWLDKAIAEFDKDHFVDYKATKYLEDGDKWNEQGDGVYTLFVEHYDTSASVKVTDNGKVLKTIKGGSAATCVGYNSSPFSHFLSLSNVANVGAALGEFLKVSEDQTIYISQWTKKDAGISISGKYNDYLTSFGYSSPGLSGPVLSIFTLGGGWGKSDATVQLGSSDYDTIIVASKAIKSEMKANGYLLSFPFKDYVGSAYVDDTKISYGGKIMEATIVGNYDIEVNPYGVSSWYKGSIEAPLEMYWAGWKFGTEDVSESDVKSAVKDFYNDFYGASLSSSQVDKILSGDYVPSCNSK